MVLTRSLDYCYSSRNSRISVWIRVLFLMKKFIHNENPGRSKNMRFRGSETIPGQEISPGMTRRASASKSNILGRRQTRWVLARHQKNETRKNHQILIDFSFVSHILYNRINWSEVETSTLKYAWPHIPSSGQTNVQILRNSTFKVDDEKSHFD